MTPSKWDGLLDGAGTDTHHQCAPAPRRGPTIIALTLLVVIVAGAAVLVWRQWTTAPTSEPAAPTPSTPVSTDPTTHATSELAASTPSTPETPSAPPDVFEPARSAAEAWMHAFMDNRTADTPWANVEGVISPYTAKPLAVYLVNTPEAQTAGVTPGTRLVSVEFSQIEADPAHPSTWSATVSYSRTDNTTGSGHFTLEPSQGGWRVTRWSAQ